uniref:Venom allergen-like protein 1 n=1 Tax=Bursaphelenchus mucronatus TaxID=6325 RepID=F2VLM5_BURMU|nr:venom allergen-like protein 1 [Bursaphelenchus mucronatus]ADV57661.1 venom allergen-like protein 1 [Bursaphelenchus mucronatus]
MSRVLVLTALFIGQIAATKFSESQKQAILDAHNSRRRTLANGEAQAQNGTMAKGANIREITWDADLESKADEWAQACNFEHPSNGGYGQNLAAQMPHVSADSAATGSAQMWWDEIKDYSGDAKFEWSTSTGHFTQMAWAETDKIGCAIQNCTNGDTQGFGEWKDWTFTVCDYMNPGNYDGEDMYIVGEPCSKCSNKGSCSDSLCSA